MKSVPVSELQVRIVELEREIHYLRAELSVRSGAERDLREQLQSLSHSRQELERIAINIAHDLQQPLRLVREYAHRCQDAHAAAASSDARAVPRSPLPAIDNVQVMIESWLSYIRADSGRELSAQLADMNAVLREAQAMCEPAIRDTGAIVTSDPLPAVRVRAPQFVRVFQNLLTNGLKYHHQRRVPEIHIAAVPKDGEWIFSIQDNGIGFAREHAERIFDLFTRLQGSAYPGAGVGLAICKRIVARHGGRIWAKSQPGEGSTFYIALPCDD